MCKFATRLRYKRLSKTQIELISPLVFVGKNRIFTVPTGFKSDGFSVTKYFEWYQDRFGKGLEGAILHDYVLQAPDIDMSFLECNDVFDDALKALGMGWWKRNILELACDLNGIFVHGNSKPNNWNENQN
jgi:hypothetical protein